MKPPKEHLIQCQRVLTALGTASNRNERTNVLKFASSTFDHNDRAIHDLEIQAGVVNTLNAHLVRAVDDVGGVKEAERLCKLLAMVFQSSNEVAAQSLCTVGTTLIPAVFKLLSVHSETGSESKYAEILLRRLSSVEVSLPSMAKNEEILDFLLKTIVSNKQANNDMINHAVSLVAGLSAHRESKAVVMKFSGMFKAVVEIANASKDDKGRYHSARVLNKLAWHTKNRATMGQTKKCVDALIAMSTSSHQNLQLESLSALYLLSIESDNKAKLVASAKGELVHSLMSVIGTQSVEKPRLQALGILLTLISRDTFKIIGSQEGLVDTMAALSTSPKESDETAGLAAQCIKRLATYVQVKDKCHEELLRAIIQMSHCERKSVQLWGAKAFLGLSALSSNSFYIVRDQDAMESVAHLIQCPHREVKEPALEAVVNLSENRSSAKKLVSSNSLVAALVSTIDERTDYDNEMLRRHAVRAILSLVSHRSSTKRIAKHLGLVAALSRYGIAAQDNDVELKRAALHGVILLAPFL